MLRHMAKTLRQTAPRGLAGYRSAIASLAGNVPPVTLPTMTAEDFALAKDLGAVRLYRRDAAAKLELNRPDRLNAWNQQLAVGLRDTIAEIAADDAVRAVLITGAGRAFSSGADLSEPAPQTPEGHRDVRSVLTERYHPIITGIRSMPKPVVAAVRGAAAGIGLSLALACDLVVASESAYFLLAFVNIGLVPDGGSSLLVPTRVGFARAAELAMLGERLPSRQALDWGLINRVVADDELVPTAEELTWRLANGPTRSYAGIKRQLNAWLYARIDDQLALEAGIQQEMAGSADFAEGVAAFGEKRTPVFRGH
jgi:2-(1,2-epoxy-1,2-dihydrophenyl)acetyl-CoA isomerase